MRNWASTAHPNQNELTGLQLIEWLETCMRSYITSIIKFNHSNWKIIVQFPEVFISDLQILIFPTFWVLLFRKILPFSYRFQDF